MNFQDNLKVWNGSVQDSLFPAAIVHLKHFQGCVISDSDADHHVIIKEL
jgi:hypothetical protein